MICAYIVLLKAKFALYCKLSLVLQNDSVTFVCLFVWGVGEEQRIHARKQSVEVRGQQFSPSTLWILAIELGIIRLGTFTH